MLAVLFLFVLQQWRPEPVRDITSNTTSGQAMDGQGTSTGGPQGPFSGATPRMESITQLHAAAINGEKQVLARLIAG